MIRSQVTDAETGPRAAVMAAGPTTNNKLELGPESPEFRATPADTTSPGLDMGTASSAARQLEEGVAGGDVVEVS